ncbi:MAG: hypothetical protein ACOVN5_08595 [Aquidulcibacter sp.]
MNHDQDIIDMDLVTAAKSDQFNAVDLPTEPQLFTIESVKVKPSEEQPVEIRMVGHKKLYRPCKTMSRVLKYIWGRDGKLYAGKSLTLFCDPEVRFGPDKTGGVRIYSMEGLEKPVAVPVNLSRKKVGGYIVRPLKIEQVQAPAPITETTTDTPAVIAERIKAATSVSMLEAIWKASAQTRRDYPEHVEALKQLAGDKKAELQAETEEAF